MDREPWSKPPGVSKPEKIQISNIMSKSWKPDGIYKTKNGKNDPPINKKLVN
jgi:hypothetical protein